MNKFRKVKRNSNKFPNWIGGPFLSTRFSILLLINFQSVVCYSCTCMLGKYLTKFHVFKRQQIYVFFFNKLWSKCCPTTLYDLTVSAEHLNAAGTSGWGLHTCSGVQWESETTAPARVIALSHTPSAIFNDDQRTLKESACFLKRQTSSPVGLEDDPYCTSDVLMHRVWDNWEWPHIFLISHGATVIWTLECGNVLMGISSLGGVKCSYCHVFWPWG